MKKAWRLLSGIQHCEKKMISSRVGRKKSKHISEDVTIVIAQETNHKPGTWEEISKQGQTTGKTEEIQIMSGFKL